MKINVPCQYCTDRHFCCHATCSKYAAYKAQLADFAEKKRKEDDLTAFLLKVYKKGRLSR